MHYCSILENNYIYIQVAWERHSTITMQLQLASGIYRRKIKPYIENRSMDIQLKKITGNRDVGSIEVPQIRVLSLFVAYNHGN
jgi:hypothetical protein